MMPNQLKRKRFKKSLIVGLVPYGCALFVAALVATMPNRASAKVETSAVYTGNVGAELSGFADDGLELHTGGTLSLSTIPAGSVILEAMLHSMDVGTPDTQNALFEGNSLGPGTHIDSDGLFPLRTIRWDVTSLVTGNGDYSARITSTDNVFGAALSVAFMHPSLPQSTVVINSGMNELYPSLTGDIESTLFDDPHIGAGASTLSLFTFADDDFATNEKILFNGALVGGPIDANLAVNPDELNSLFKLKVNTLAGANTAAISSPDNGDQFGWPVAVLVSPRGVPEPAGLGLIAMAATMVVACRRKAGRRV